jgi:hypothetical protein
MACITGDSSNIFINNGNLVMSQDVYANTIHLSQGVIATGNVTATRFFCDAPSIQITQVSPSLTENQVSIGIGSAPLTNQGSDAIAIGHGAGLNSQNACAIAIGMDAGQSGQGLSSIAIGAGAGASGQHPNTIILSARATTGSTPALNSQQSDSFYVAPIRSSTSCQMLGYDSANCEVLQTSSVTVLNSNVGVSNTSPGHPFVVGASNLVVSTNGHIGINTVPNNAQVTIVNSSGTQTALAISGTTDQTANIQTWSTNGNVVASVSNIGGVTLAGPLARQGFSNVTDAAYTVKPTDTWIIVGNATDVTLNLPDPVLGREIGIRKRTGGSYHVYSATTNVLDLTGALVTTIIESNHKLVYLVADGTNWVVMNTV